MFMQICFDIVNDRSRARVVSLLKGEGYRVQKSVFECPNLTEERFLKLKDAIESEIDLLEDSVRYYLLCRSCVAHVELSGVGDLPACEKFRIV